MCTALQIAIGPFQVNDKLKLYHLTLVVQYCFTLLWFNSIKQLLWFNSTMQQKLAKLTWKNTSKKFNSFKSQLVQKDLAHEVLMQNIHSFMAITSSK